MLRCGGSGRVVERQLDAALVSALMRADNKQRIAGVKVPAGAGAAIGVSRGSNGAV